MGTYDQALAAAQRALALATAIGEVGLQARRSLYLGIAYPGQGDYRRAMDCHGADGAASRDRGAASASACPVCASVHARIFLACAMPSWATFAEGAPWRGRAPDCRGGRSPREPVMAYWAVASLPSAKGTCAGHFPCLNRPSASVRRRTSRPFSLGGRPWGRCTRWPGASRRPCRGSRRRWSRPATTDFMPPGALGLCLGEAQLLPADWRRRTPSPSTHWRYSERVRNGATKPMRCASWRRSRRRREPSEGDQVTAHYRQALTLAEELGMRPLMAHCHLGLGTLYSRIGQKGAGSHRTVHRAYAIAGPWA